LAKPFSIQAPEDIAKEYAGNKQMIAQAAQMGVVDPTAAVLAGMFIDRMRSAQVMEAGQMPSVAQQVLGGQPPAPPAPPAGLGATPEGAAMPPMDAAPQMGPPPQEMAPPQEMPSMAEGGMVPPYASGGGLSDVPIPDGMFDEPSNGGFGDGYAGGGMVAFAPGGDVDFERFRKAIIDQESGGDYGVANAEGSGALGAYQFMPPTARALAERLGLPYRPELLQGSKGRSKEGRAYQDALGTAQLQDAIKFGGGDIGKAGAFHFAGPNKSGYGPKTRKYEQDILRRYSGSKEGSEMMPERNISTAEGRGMSYEDSAALAGRLLKDPEEYAQAKEEARARFAEMRSPEEYEKQRKGDMWQTLAEIGFNMASSKAPNVLQAIGEAAVAAMPGARADRKERKELKDRALDGLLKLGAQDRTQAKEVLSLGTDIYQTGLKQEQFDQELNYKKEVSKEELKLGRDKLNAEIAAAKSTGMNVTATVFSMFNSGNPAMKAAAEEWIMLNNPPSGSGADVAQRLKELREGRDGSGGSATPATPKGFVVD
jgi:hypothetical protein